MLINPSLYTVESVTSGHPDKICDQISDAILDEYLKQDSKSRVAIETFGGHGMLVIMGEITSKREVNYQAVAEEVYRKIGYEDNLEILTNVTKQSPDIAQGVDVGGAGDQGIMYGFATAETAEFLPRGLVLAHKLAQKLQELRESKELSWLGPDGKTQATLKDGRITTLLASTQHQPGISTDEIRESLIEKLFRPIVGSEMENTEILINPTGIFSKGGFEADTGLTGRKIMIDTYGGLVPHGGGCFSGKDPTKVDRSGAYMCRFAAKNAVASGLAKECLVSVAYAIGRAEPVMIEAVNEKGENISSWVRQNFDFRPQAIIERLDLLRPIYLGTATYGHFGKSELPWENIEL